jgi:hypothetical protein
VNKPKKLERVFTFLSDWPADICDCHSKVYALSGGKLVELDKAKREVKTVDVLDNVCTMSCGKSSCTVVVACPEQVIVYRNGKRVQSFRIHYEDIASTPAVQDDLVWVCGTAHNTSECTIIDLSRSRKIGRMHPCGNGSIHHILPMRTARGEAVALVKCAFTDSVKLSLYDFATGTELSNIGRIQGELSAYGDTLLALQHLDNILSVYRITEQGKVELVAERKMFGVSGISSNLVTVNRSTALEVNSSGDVTDIYSSVATAPLVFSKGGRGIYGISDSISHYECFVFSRPDELTQADVRELRRIRIKHNVISDGHAPFNVKLFGDYAIITSDIGICVYSISSGECIRYLIPIRELHTYVRFNDIATVDGKIYVTGSYGSCISSNLRDWVCNSDWFPLSGGWYVIKARHRFWPSAAVMHVYDNKRKLRWIIPSPYEGVPASCGDYICILSDYNTVALYDKQSGRALHLIRADSECCGASKPLVIPCTQERFAVRTDQSVTVYDISSGEPKELYRAYGANASVSLDCSYVTVPANVGALIYSESGVKAVITLGADIAHYDGKKLATLDIVKEELTIYEAS